MHTTMGDMHIKLYPEECPKTVENFTTHCRNGYYDNHLFHRVIKGFMVQTGDPLGDGTGGQSIWGREFEDEFHKRYIIFFTAMPAFMFGRLNKNKMNVKPSLCYVFLAVFGMTGRSQCQWQTLVQTQMGRSSLLQRWLHRG